MSRDYKPSPEQPKKTSKGSPFIAGLLIGFLLGIAVSLAIVMYIKGGENTFTQLTNAKKPLSEKIAENTKHQPDASNNTHAPLATDDQEPNTPTDSQDDKTRFDFYTILPGSESKVNTEDIKIKENQAHPMGQYTYFLQVGAFQTGEEADNMKAKLALQGFEASVQTATIPDKGAWHRVRVGPLKSLEQINKTKTDLAGNGFKADLIKINVAN